MPTILLADDSKNIREYCQRELEDEGYDVIAARDGSEVLKIMSEIEPDLVILDICMPGLDGLTTLSHIKTLHPGVAVVFFTSFDDVCVRDERSRFATACVEKQGDLTELKNVVRCTLKSKRRNQSYRVGLPITTRDANPTP